MWSRSAIPRCVHAKLAWRKRVEKRKWKTLTVIIMAMINWILNFATKEYRTMMAVRVVECADICLCSRALQFSWFTIHHTHTHTFESIHTIPICHPKFTHILRVSQVAFALNTPTVRQQLRALRRYTSDQHASSNRNCCQREIGSTVNFYCFVVKSTGIRLTSLALQ